MATTPKSAAIAEVRRFTGFLAVDGTTHNTEKQAIEHTIQVKTIAALNALAKGIFDEADRRADAGNPTLPDGFSANESGTGAVIMGAESLALFLFSNRAAIKQAFEQDVRLRKQRGPKPKKSATPAEPTEPTDTAAAAS